MGLLMLMGDSGFNVRSELFGAGEQGAWYDPSDFSTMWQDAAGNTPVTASGDPVGLILDKSRSGPSMGSNQITNGGFDADSDWTKGTGWSIGSGVATKSAGSASVLSQAQTMTAGRYYIVTYTITRSAGSITPQFAGGSTVSGTARSSSGTFTDIMTAASGNNTVQFSADASFAGTVDDVSVKVLSDGNHAYQSTSGARPTLARVPFGGRRNLLTRTEEFDNAAWTKFQSTISPNATTAPDGTSTADSLVDTAVTQEHTCYQSQTTTTATFSVYAKANARSTVGLRAYSNVNEFYTAIFDLQNGVVSLDNETGTTFSSTTSSITSVGSGWYRCSISYTRSSGTTFHVIDLCNSTTPTLGTAGSQIYLGNGTGIFIWGAQLETGSTATNYQKVVATTDVTESGVGDLWHLVFDGSDDSLVTNSVDFSGTAQMTVIAGVRKLSDAARGMVVELSANTGTNAGSFLIAAPDFALNDFGSYSRGSAVTSALSSAIAAPATRVLSFYSDISQDSLTQRINGTDNGSSSSDQGTGNFGNYQLFIGRRNQATLPFNGHIYQLIIRGKTTPTGKLLEAERFVARKTGVTF